MKQTMGTGTNIGWIGCRATCALEEMLSSGIATADLTSPLVGMRKLSGYELPLAGSEEAEPAFGRARRGDAADLPLPAQQNDPPKSATEPSQASSLFQRRGLF